MAALIVYNLYATENIKEELMLDNCIVARKLKISYKRIVTMLFLYICKSI